MALLGFFEKNEIKGAAVLKLFQESVAERSPAFISNDEYVYEGDILAHVDNVFYLSNSLSREQVLDAFKGKVLNLKVALGGTLYVGETRLLGLGRYRNLNILKLKVPQILENKDPRSAYRLRTFSQTPFVSFSYGENNIAKGQILDISMSGAGFRPDALYSSIHSEIEIGKKIGIDIRLEDNWKLSTYGLVRHITFHKIGIEFSYLSEEQKDHLFKYIVKMRKVETQKKLALQESIISKKEGQKEVAGTDGRPAKPRAIVFFKLDEPLAEFLEKVLCRRFDVFVEELNMIDVREKIGEIDPDLILFEMLIRESAAVTRSKKVAAAMAGYTPYMLYGENFKDDFLQIHFGADGQNKMVLDTSGRSTILCYKRIEAFFGKK